MSKKTFLVYPCGKKFEIRVPIAVKSSDGKPRSVLPGSDNYFEHAKNKFEINNLRVIEEEVLDKAPAQPTPFVSLTRKVRSVE